MENLEKHNLISGVVSDEPASDSANRSEMTAANQSGIAPANQNAITEAPTPTDRKEPEHSVREKSESEGDDSYTERIISKVLERFDSQLREAEDRGFRRGLEMARQNPAAVGADRTVPNFLADIRRDVWE